MNRMLAAQARDHCGCATPALVLGVALVATVGWEAWQWEQVHWTPWQAAWLVVGYN
jgi:hypothetical protein